MPRPRTFLVALVMLALLLPSAPAAARQIDARDRPRVSGPLDPRARDCKTRWERWRGRIIAVARSCVRFYRFRPGFETDTRRNYGVVWLQTTVDSRRSWCTSIVRSDIDIPLGARLHERAPDAFNARTARPVRTRLNVGARGFALERAVVHKRFTLFPRRLRSHRNAAARAWRTVWHGSTKAVVAAASGIAISWPQEAAPPSPVTSGLRYELRRTARC